MLARLLVLLHTLVHPSFAATPAPELPIRYLLRLIILDRGQPPLIVLLACGLLRANRAVTVFAVLGRISKDFDYRSDDFISKLYGDFYKENDRLDNN
jgi:hypothetical protein